MQFYKRNCARSFLVWKSFIQPANHVAIELMSQSYLWKIAAWFASSMMDIGKTKLRGFKPASFYKCTGPHLPPGTTAPIFTRKWNEASWIIRIIPSAYSSRNRGLAILTLPPHRPPPLLKFGPLPEINFFGVSDDLEEKKLYKKTFGLRTFFNFFFFTNFHFYFWFYNECEPNPLPPASSAILTLPPHRPPAPVFLGPKKPPTNFWVKRP